MEKLTDFSSLIQAKVVDYAPKVILAVLTLVIGFAIIGWITKKITKTLKKGNVDPTVRPFIGSLISVGLKVLVLFSVAGMFGIETTSFIAIFSALAFAIGLALQGSLGHFASGVLLLIFKPYVVGDLVELDGKTGVVESIQIFTTVLRTLDNKRVILPNGLVTDGVITNISGQGEIRVDMVFGIGYGEDIDKARSVIQQVASTCPQISTEKPVDILVTALADSSVNFDVRPWCNSEHYWDVYYFMHENIKKAFDKESIEIPFPQRSIHMVTS